MAPRWRFIVVLAVVLLMAAFCGARHLRADDHARPRSHGSSASSHSSGQGAQHAQPRGGSGSRHEARPPQGNRQPRTDGRRYDNRSEAERRHPQPDPGRHDYGRDGRGRDYSRYHWQGRTHYERWGHYRFPRTYDGLGLFGRYYRGYGFGPHYRLWYYGRSGWSLFYWPYAYEPLYGCGWYWVPTDRRLVTDPETGEEYWDYTDYQYRYLCFD